MFITEAQLALYKYQDGTEYFNKTMAEIFSVELLKYSKKQYFYVVECISWFLNKKLSSNVWKIYFNDESVAIIKISDLNKLSNCRDIEIQTFNFDIKPDAIFSS